VIAGPTAVGKTALAVELCEAVGGEVVGADSRQVYRRMDIGTAKPSSVIRDRVRHHLVDIVDPDEKFDASIWRDRAITAIGAIEKTGRMPVVCGGTGLYIRSLTEGLFDAPAADDQLRADLARAEEDLPGSLYARLTQVDADAAKRIHANDMVRIVRALEVAELTGKPISVWQREHALADQPFEVLTLELGLERQELYARIDRRCQEMVDAGLLDELADLRAEGFAADLTAFDAIGYREAGMCLDGTLAREDLAAAVAQATRNYAKRQLIWIRGQMETVVVVDVASALARVEEFLHGGGGQQGS
jgi:tRNA dimethylallyltransferase